MTREQKERIVMVRSPLEFVQLSIAKLDEKLDKMVAPYESAITLLCTIPGVDRASAITIISTCLSLVKFLRLLYCHFIRANLEVFGGQSYTGYAIV